MFNFAEAMYHRVDTYHNTWLYPKTPVGEFGVPVDPETKVYTRFQIINHKPHGFNPLDFGNMEYKPEEIQFAEVTTTSGKLPVVQPRRKHWRLDLSKHNQFF